jgi:hypothetical protein
MRHVSGSGLVGGRYAVPFENGVQLPLTGESSELVRATILELQVRPRHHVPNGTRHEHLARSRLADDPSACVDRDPSDLAVVSDALSGVQSRPDLESQLGKRYRDSPCAPDRRCRRVEGGEEAVAGIIDLASTPSIEKFADSPVMRPQEQSPPAVAERRCQPCRADKVGEEQRDQDAALSLVGGRCAISLFLAHGGPSLPFLSAVRVQLYVWNWGSAKLIEYMRSPCASAGCREVFPRDERRPPGGGPRRRDETGA